MVLTGETDVLGENPVSATVCTTNHRRTEPGSNPDLRDERPGTSRLNHGMVNLETGVGPDVTKNRTPRHHTATSLPSTQYTSKCTFCRHNKCRNTNAEFTNAPAVSEDTSVDQRSQTPRHVERRTQAGQMPHAGGGGGGLPSGDNSVEVRDLEGL
jgi:hypothetical protein